METFGNLVTGFLIAAFSSFSVLFFIIIIYISIISTLVGLGLFILWIITLIDCVQRDEKDFPVGGDNAKILWILLLVLINNIVPIIYYFLIMRKKPGKAKK